MMDNFALLNEPRRPWIDTDSLKQKFLSLSAQTHPDRFHAAPDAERTEASRRFSDINTAYNCLREPKERVRHLLELELGAKPAGIQRVPQEMMDSFFEVGALCKEVDAFLEGKAAVTSPILQVQWFERGQDWLDKISALRQKIETRRDGLIIELKAMNPAWESAAARDARLLERLDEIYRLLGYLGRWSEQLQERFVKLTL